MKIKISIENGLWWQHAIIDTNDLNKELYTDNGKRVLAREVE